MGVPKLSKWLRDHAVFGDAFKGPKPAVKTLALDLNGLIHPVAQRAERYEDIAPGVMAEIKRWVDTVKPSQKLIVAVDGVAPMAKMVQQRKRRFLAHANAGDTDEFLTIDSDVPEIDTNFISPGTLFMSQLHKLLNEELPKLNLTVVYSSYLVAGEGEHKIVQLLREDVTHNNTVLIHSADADMIMISLMLVADEKIKNLSELYILRDTPFGTEYVNIGKMYKDIKQKLPFKYSVESLVSIISLIGNDFLPHCPSFRVVERALDALWDSLVAWNRPVCIPGSIDWDSYLGFLKHVNDNHIPNLFSGWVKNEQFQGRTQFKTLSPMQERFAEFGVTKETRKQWYQHVYAGNIRDNDVVKYLSGQDIRAVCTNFAEGLEFVFRYYSMGAQSINKRWYYAMHDAPLFSDLISTLERKPSLSKAYLGPPGFMTIYEQLAIILPPSAKSFLPAKMLPIYSKNSPLRDLFPKQVWIQKSGLAVFYQSIFFLPVPDPDKVTAVLNYMIKDEKLRNRTGGVKIFSAVKERVVKRVNVKLPGYRDVKLPPLGKKQFD